VKTDNQDGKSYCVSSLLSSIRVEALNVPLRFDFDFDGRVFTNTVGAGALSYLNNSYRVYPEGQTLAGNEPAPGTNFAAVDPPYFETMRIPIIRGRSLTSGDTEKSPLVAIVNEAMAARV
jgi:hypothetical protein